MNKLLSLLVDLGALLLLVPLSLSIKKLYYNRNFSKCKYPLLSLELAFLVRPLGRYTWNEVIDFQSYLCLRSTLYGIIAIAVIIAVQRLCVPAITGGIGAGKSTLGKYLESKGFFVIDSDSIGRQFLVSGTVGYNNLVKSFGRVILSEDGEIDKATLREIVYNDPAKRRLLNKCLHKHIISKIFWDVVKYRLLSWKDLIIIEVPLLYETHLSWVCGPIVVCLASEETRLKRCRTRNSEISKDTYINIMKSQMPNNKLLAWGDVVLENESTLEEYYKRADQLVDHYLL